MKFRLPQSFMASESVMLLARKLIGIGHLAVIFGMFQTIPTHVAEQEWPLHAQSHVLQSLIWVIGLNILCLIILVHPFMKKEKWAWWTLLMSGIFVYGGYFTGLFITGGGDPGIYDDLFFGVLWLLNGMGLAVSWKYFTSL